MSAYWEQWDYEEIESMHGSDYPEDDEEEDYEEEAIEEEYQSQECPYCSRGCRYCLGV